MPSRTARVLCTGNEPELLQTRCAILAHAGYDAQAATLPAAEILLRTEQFDPIVVSAWLSESERSSILSVAANTPTFVLTELTLPPTRLAEVARLLPSPGGGPERIGPLRLTT